VYLVGLDGGLPKRVETDQKDAETPFWSPDGNWLFFSSPVKGERQIFKVSPAGGRATQLTTGEGHMPRVSVDGRRVYYCSNRPEPSISSVSVMGGDERPLSGGKILPKYFPSWEVTARGLYHVHDENGPALFLLDLATGRSRRVAELPKNTDPAWCTIAVAADGRSVIVPRNEAETSDIMLIEDFR
jgi:Tol biopolymer transport system component